MFSVKSRWICVAAVILLLLNALSGWRISEAGEIAATDASLDLSSYRGKVVYLDFWASWCVPCRKSFPWLNAMQHKYGGQGLVVIGVNLDTEKRLADRFLKRFPAEFKVIYDPEGRLAKAYELKGMPSVYIIDRRGRLRASHIGFRRSQTGKYEAEIASLLNE